jgi:hemoglobin
MTSYDLIDAVGGPEVMQELMQTFYDRLFDDLMVGFFFANSDKDALVRSQIAYVHAHLGDRSGDYQGPSIYEAHKHMPILAGHFDRRHQILQDVLAEFDVPEQVQVEWLALDRAMRPMVLRQGREFRRSKGIE